MYLATSANQPDQIKQSPYKEKGLKPGDIIGQEGLEKFTTIICAARMAIGR